MAVVGPIEPSEVSLYGHIYPIRGLVTKRRATQVSAPIRTGEPSRADQQFASEVIWEDLSGGVGVLHMDEREAPDRYNFGSVNTLVKKQVAELPYPNAIAHAGAAVASYIGAVEFNSYVYFLGNAGSGYVKRVPKNGTQMEFLENNAGTYAWVTTLSGGASEYTLPALPFAAPVVWKNTLWIPCQGGGIVKLDPTSTAAPITYNTYTARLAFLFREDLVIVTNPNNGSSTIYSTDDTTPTAAADWLIRGALDSIGLITGACVHVNAAGEPTPWIASDRGLHQLDWDNQVVYDAGIAYRDSSGRNGLAMCRWDGDLWYGKGANAHQVVNGARVVRGPNVGDGLPTLYQGWVRSFEPHYDNFLIALLSGSGNFSSILAYNRRGWHPLALGASTYVDMIRVTDSFERSDSASSLGTADYTAGGGTGASGTWVAGSGTWGITVNRAYPVAPAANQVAVVDSGTADHTVSVTIPTNPSSATGARVIFRYADEQNYNFVQRTATGYDFYTRVAGVNTNIASTAAFTPADDDQISITCIGDRIVVYVNANYAIGGSTVVTSSANNTATKAGIGVGAAVAARFKDLNVTVARQQINSIVASFAAENAVPRLWYGQLGTIYWFHLPDLTDNPARHPAIRPMGTGELHLPWFDGGLAEVQKTALNVQVRTRDMNNGATLTVYYALDDGSGWTQLYDGNGVAASITSAGVSTLYFDAAKLGTLFYNARLRIVFSGGTAAGSVSPTQVFIKIRYLRELVVKYGYDMDIDLTDDYGGRTVDEMIHDLEDAVESRLLGEFAYQSGYGATDTKTVFILVYGSPQGAGPDRGGYARVSVLEVS